MPALLLGLRGTEEEKCSDSLLKGLHKYSVASFPKFLQWRRFKCWGLPLRKHEGKKTPCYLLVTLLLNRNYNCFDLAVQRPSHMCPLQLFCMQFLVLKFSEVATSSILLLTAFMSQSSLRLGALGFSRIQHLARSMPSSKLLLFIKLNPLIEINCVLDFWAAAIACGRE